MEVSTPPKGPKRQETLGPTSPIQDWEVERATILADSKTTREKANRLEKQLDTERQMYEKNTNSLLREVKLKEAFTDKKLKDVEEQLMKEVLELQRKLDDEKISRQKEIQAIRNEHEIAAEQEDKKYQRRLASLQERLNAKDKEYAELFEKEKQEQYNAGEEKDKDKLVESLKLELAKEKSQNEHMRTLNSPTPSDTEDTTTEQANGFASQNDTQKISREFQELEIFCKTIQGKLEESEQNLKSYQQSQLVYIETVNALEEALSEAQRQSQTHKKRLDQIVSGHDAHINELTEKFMSEAASVEMTNQAQLQNFQSEHAELVRELREQHQTEKEVWEIEHKAMIDETRRDLNFEKEEAIRELTKEWNDKNEDLHASMSKDAMEIQKHWETKLEKAKAKSALKESRLLGEMEVIKDRLGREIQRRKQYQATLAGVLERNEVLDSKSQKLQKKCSELLKSRTMLDKEISQLKNQYRTAYRLSLDLLAITSPKNVGIQSNSTLSDVLQTAVRQVSIMRIHGETQQDHQESSFDIDTIPTYGF